MTIKETAGKILLALYYLQTNNPVDLEQTSIVFIAASKPKLDTKSKFKNMLHDINDNDAVLYNAFNYLLEKRLIAKKNNKTIYGGMFLLGLHVTHEGIDVIEGVEQGPEQQQVFKSLFNITFSPKIKVDSLVKSEVGNIVGIGGAVGGKLNL